MRACMYVCLYVTGQECMEACRHAGRKGRAMERRVTRPARRGARAGRRVVAPVTDRGVAPGVANVVSVDAPWHTRETSEMRLAARQPVTDNKGVFCEGRALEPQVGMNEGTGLQAAGWAPFAGRDLAKGVVLVRLVVVEIRRFGYSRVRIPPR